MLSLARQTNAYVYGEEQFSLCNFIKDLGDCT